MKTGPAPFVMPRFSRTQWVSDRAREAWEAKMTRFAECWRQIEWMTVLNGVRPCASFWVSHGELALLARVLEGRGLRVSPLLWRRRSNADADGPLHRVAVGKGRDLRRFCRAWRRGDHEAVGSLLGYPQCCRAFFREVFVDAELSDGVWPMALRSCAGAREEGLIEVGGAAELNPFWMDAGVRLVPHYACRFDCAESVQLAQGFCQTGTRAGFGDSIQAALEIFGWPVEWSGLHGIAEIRTPILKTTRNTDVSPRKRIVRRAGPSFPEVGARGLSFALKSPPRLRSLPVLR